MTTLTFSHTPLGHNASSGFKAAKQFTLRKIEELKARHQRKKALRKALDEVRQLSARDLADLDMTREQLENAVRAGF